MNVEASDRELVEAVLQVQVAENNAFVALVRAMRPGRLVQWQQGEVLLNGEVSSVRGSHIRAAVVKVLTDNGTFQEVPPSAIVSAIVKEMKHDGQP